MFHRLVGLGLTVAGLLLTAGGGLALAAARGVFVQLDAGQAVQQAESLGTTDEPASFAQSGDLRNPATNPEATATTAQTSTITSAPTLTPQPTLTATPSPSPTPDSREQIVFARGLGTEREIFLMSLVDGGVRQLTFNDFLDEAPSMGPGGRQIVFTSARTAYELYLLDVQTQNHWQLTNLSGLEARFPQWSPVAGDDRIVFEARDAGRRNSIWIVRADSSDLQQLTPWGADSRPVWGHDGTYIVFGRALRDSYGDGRVTTTDFLDVFRLDFATGRETQLTNTVNFDEFQFAVDPASGLIAFSRVSGDTNGDGFVNLNDQVNLYLMEPDSGNVRPGIVGRDRVFSPTFSADGRYVLFDSSRGSESGRLALWEIAMDQISYLTESGPYFHPEFGR